MEERANKRDYGVFLSLLGIFAAVLICVWAVIARTARPHDPISTDRAKLSQVASGLYGYALDHGDLPSPAEYKANLMDGGYVEDETSFYSYSKAGCTEIRYFVSGNRFVLVTPGANDRYDTPEGYEELENAKATRDDLLRFGAIGAH